MYNDDGEQVDVGSSPCHFLRISASVAPLLDGTGRVSGQMRLSFGDPKDLSQASCGLEPYLTAQQTTAWPVLAGVEVLGWGAPVDSVRMDTLRCASDGSIEHVVSSQMVPIDQVKTLALCEARHCVLCTVLHIMCRRFAQACICAQIVTDGRLRMEFSKLQNSLSCQHEIKVTWLSTAPRSIA